MHSLFDHYILRLTWYCDFSLRGDYGAFLGRSRETSTALHLVIIVPCWERLTLWRGFHLILWRLLSYRDVWVEDLEHRSGVFLWPGRTIIRLAHMSGDDAAFSVLWWARVDLLEDLCGRRSCRDTLHSQIRWRRRSIALLSGQGSGLLSKGLRLINTGIRLSITINIVRLCYNGSRCKPFIISSVARQRRKILFNSLLIALFGLVKG